MLSAMGLGLYGEPINPNAWQEALLSFQRVLKNGGRLLLCVQLGKKNLLHFNSHRIFTLQTILEVLENMRLIELSFIKGEELEVYNCIKYQNDEGLLNAQNLGFLVHQDSITGLLEFEKI